MKLPDIFAYLERDRRPPRNWAHRFWPIAEMPHYPHTRRTFAFHEAGHILFCHLQGLSMLGARLDADGTGSVKLDIDRIQASARELANVAIPRSMEEKLTLDLTAMYVAGVIAECTLYGIIVNGTLARDCIDWRNARKLLTNAFGNDHGIFYCQELARFVLLKHWPLVTRLAVEIDSKGLIGVERVKEICASCEPDPLCIS